MHIHKDPRPHELHRFASELSFLDMRLLERRAPLDLCIAEAYAENVVAAED
jgi:hypothetical protein